MMNTVMIVENLLNERELTALSHDCSSASCNFMKQDDYHQTSCGKLS